MKINDKGGLKLYLLNLVTELAKKYGPPPEPIKVMDVLNNPYLNRGKMEEMLMDTNSLTDGQLYEFIKKNYESILDVTFYNDTYIVAFLDPRFLKTMISVISTVPYKYNIKKDVSKIVFDYMSLPPQDRNSNIFTLMQEFGKVGLRDSLPMLIGIGVPEYYAIYLTAAMNSTSTPRVNIQRVNFIMANAEEGIFDEQKIVNVYSHFGSYGGLTMSNLLSAHMFLAEQKNASEQVYEAYSLISLAVLDMLNAMTSVEIEQVLKSYSSDFAMKYQSDVGIIRFSLQALSMDYSRISAVAVNLNDTGSYYVP